MAYVTLSILVVVVNGVGMHSNEKNPLLDIKNLNLNFVTDRGCVQALNNVSLQVGRGECVALIGESGSGKSITGLAVMRLHGKEADISAEAMTLDGQSIAAIPEKLLHLYRGKRVAMIFQNAKSALNPIRRVGDTLVDIMLAHASKKISRKAARQHVLSVMEQVGIVRAEERMAAYPAELSGGMCQRIMIVAALVCEPELIIADEPTSALDVTTQVKVMNLLMGACRERGVACLFITHDLALAGEYCDRTIVMHAGQVLEDGPAKEVLSAPSHPYTRMLVAAMPYGKKSYKELTPMQGNLPDLRRTDLPSCRFAERCPKVEDRCRTQQIPSIPVSTHHIVRCYVPNII
jgi:peptide/nickel transport system ATP-binding protein